VQDRVGVVGVGYEGFRPAISDISTRELMFEAASKAYIDAGVDPRKDVGSFICCTEDFWEGWSITDEMVPDQVGGARRPVCTVPSDGLVGIGHAVMHIRAGVADVVAVEAHSKVADVVDKRAVENLALDPAFHRVVGANSDVLAGLEMSGFIEESGISREMLSEAVRLEKRAALRNPRASYGADLSSEEISRADRVAGPLRRYDRPDFAEGGVVFVLASEKWVKKNKKDAVFVDGVAWRSSSPWFDGGSFKTAKHAEDAVASVFKQSGSGPGDFDLMEVDDTYSFKLFQHLMAAGVDEEEALSMLKSGKVNPSGGSLGTGYLIEATGSHKLLECVLQLRKESGGNQVRKATRALALSWRGNPTGSGAAVGVSLGD
jgi:acetyl-CoA C-acetyltransferase